MKKFSDKKIIDSWKKNAVPWVTAVQKQQIESRRLVTDQAIIDSISACAGNSVLDIGCGEGWLARKLNTLGLKVSGIDVVPELVEEARKNNNGNFNLLAYEAVSDKTITEKFDIAVCNFSLLGKESVEKLFKVIPALLNDGGFLIIQTPHPVVSCGDLPYHDDWRSGSWAGFSHEFSDPAPWYFRTIESWLTLFLSNHFQITQLKEPVAPHTGKAASLILAGRIAHQDT